MLTQLKQNKNDSMRLFYLHNYWLRINASLILTKVLLIKHVIIEEAGASQTNNFILIITFASISTISLQLLQALGKFGSPLTMETTIRKLFGTSS